MIKLSTTKLTSKGQVVIPEDVRDQLGLEPGMQFVVLGSGDSVVFKRITAPSKKEFRSLLDEAAKQARQAGLKRSDITKAVQRVRKRK